MSDTSLTPGLCRGQSRSFAQSLHKTKALSAIVLTFSLYGCKTPADANSQSKYDDDESYLTEKLPLFDLQEWRKHPGPPAQEPYFLQQQLYTMVIEAPNWPDSDEKMPASFTISNASGAVINTSKTTIKVRGYTSRNFDKKQYGLSLVDDAGADKKASLIDMPAAEDWVLSAPFNDKSLLRDITAYNLSNKLGRHAPRTRILALEMKISGVSEKMGIYVLTEKNTFGPGRIEVPKKSAEDTAFQASFDHKHEGDKILWKGRGTDLILEYPSAEKITPEQEKEFRKIFGDVEARMKNPSGPRWDKVFDDRLDLASAVDFFIVQELARNPDGFRLSSGIYIPPKGKIYFGPPWDFNIAFGNDKDENGVQTDGWRSKEKGIWFQVLFNHPQFCNALKTRWTEARRTGAISNDTIFGIIDQHAAVMEPLAAENFTKWPSLGLELWPNPYWLKTWEGERDALKSWISLRTQWLDKAIAQLTCQAAGKIAPADPELPSQ